MSTHRPRRLRTTPAMRRLVRETRPHAAELVLPVFVREAGAFVAPVDLAPGKWILRIEALAKDGTTFRQQRQLYVKG